MFGELPESPGVCFRPVGGLDGYAVGDDGTIWSRHPANGRMPPGWHRLSVYRRATGGRYCVAYFREDSGRGRMVSRYLHRVVLAAFVGPCPPGLVCRHMDGDTANNRLSNLRWGTPKENIADKKRHGTHCPGTQSSSAKLTTEQVGQVLLLCQQGVSYPQIARLMGVSATAIGDLARGRRYSADTGIVYQPGRARRVSRGWTQNLTAEQKAKRSARAKKMGLAEMGQAALASARAASKRH